MLLEKFNELGLLRQNSQMCKPAKTIMYFAVFTETDTPFTRMLFYINSVLSNLFLPSNHISKFYLLW
jgi:hypothetical protein